MDSVFIAARAGVDEIAAAPSATVAGPNSASLRVIVMGTSLSRETLSLARRRGNVEREGGIGVHGIADLPEFPRGRHSATPLYGSRKLRPPGACPTDNRWLILPGNGTVASTWCLFRSAKTVPKLWRYKHKS